MRVVTVELPRHEEFPELSNSAILAEHHVQEASKKSRFLLGDTSHGAAVLSQLETQDMAV